MKGEGAHFAFIALSFGMAFAFMMFIKDLRRNGGETAENRNQDTFFLFLDELYISELF